MLLCANFFVLCAVTRNGSSCCFVACAVLCTEATDIYCSVFCRVKNSRQKRVRLFSRFQRGLQPHSTSNPQPWQRPLSEQWRIQVVVCSRAQTTKKLVRVCMSFPPTSCVFAGGQNVRKFNFHKFQKFKSVFFSMSKIELGDNNLEETAEKTRNNLKNGERDKKKVNN